MVISVDKSTKEFLVVKQIFEKKENLVYFSSYFINIRFV